MSRGLEGLKRGADLPMAKGAKPARPRTFTGEGPRKYCPGSGTYDSDNYGFQD